MVKYIIKDIKYDFYYACFEQGWTDSFNMAEVFDTKEEAEKILKNQDNGWYKIEEIYIVES